MAGHIYRNENVIQTKDRPNFFIKELKMYLDYLKNELANAYPSSAPQAKKLRSFSENLIAGIEYYQALFTNSSWFADNQNKILGELSAFKEALMKIGQLETAIPIK